MRDRSSIATLTLAALAVGVLFGCGSPQPKSTPAPGASTHDTAIVRLGSEAIDMITDSGTFPGKRYLIDKATERATEQCMDAAGVPWSGFAGEPPAASDEDWILRPQARARNGYDITRPPASSENGDGAETTASRRTMAALVGSPPRRATLVLPGLADHSYPVSGCLAQARAAVAGDTATWELLSYLPGELNGRLAQKAAGNPRFLAAQGRWKQCMAEHKYIYSTPADIRIDLAEQLSTHPQRSASLHALEITLAVQDARCDHEAKLSLTELSLRRDAAQTIDPAHRKQITDLTTKLNTAIGRARGILRQRAWRMGCVALSSRTPPIR